MIPAVEKCFYFLVDNAHRIFPSKRPSKACLSHCKIISHRGEHNNKDILENTLPAFDKLLQSKVWGIELDIRWTLDCIPVVFHDATLQRLFNRSEAIAQLSFTDLKKICPQIPSLAEVVKRYGKKLHLMIEVKAIHEQVALKQLAQLQAALHDLEAIKDYHLIAIDSKIFTKINFVPTNALIPIAIINYEKKSQEALKKHYGGVAGHYQFLTRKRILKHQEQDQKVGVGFVVSKNSLYRELNRGVEWVFTNKALYLTKFI